MENKTKRYRPSLTMDDLRTINAALTNSQWRNSQAHRTIINMIIRNSADVILGGGVLTGQAETQPSDLVGAIKELTETAPQRVLSDADRQTPEYEAAYFRLVSKDPSFLTKSEAEQDELILKQLL